MIEPALSEAQGALMASGASLLSLAPGRGRATPLSQLVHQLLEEIHPQSDMGRAFQQGISRIGLAMLEHFPDNIFWDLDYLAQSLLHRPDARAIGATADTVVRLMEGFGRHGPICFRYVHDFIYGYDWARWVKKAPQQRGHELPFGPGFLIYIEERMHQLRELICAGDQKYGPLGPHEQWRNPFGFSREPADEQRLLERLAAERAIPVPAWDPHGAPDWRRPYAQIRHDVAVQIGAGR